MQEPHAPEHPPIDTGAHRLRLLPDMRQLLDTFFADVSRARSRVLVECYIVNDDGLGNQLGDALIEAAGRGVRACLLYDALGSHTAGKALFERIAAGGVEVRAYRGGARQIAKMPRDHGRVMVVDDAAYTGGAAWGDQWLPAERGGEGWHDVCTRIEGPAVADFVHVFDTRWQEATDDQPPRDVDTADRYGDLRLLADAPDAYDRILELHTSAFEQARRRIWIANSYFYPPTKMRDTLVQAAGRGVDVRVLTVGETDLPLIKRAARADYGMWLAAGFRLFEYRPTVMHSKYAVVDDGWCSVGTFNANATSLVCVNEINLIVHDRAFVATVAAQFEEDLTHGEEITAESHRARPIMTRVVDQLAAGAMRFTDVLASGRRS